MNGIPRRKTAFVTGGTGFLGWEIIRQLLEAGHHVVALSRSGDLPGDLPRAALEIVRGDLDDVETLTEAMRGASVVYHVAADVRMWRAKWVEIERTNVTGTRNMLSAARRAGVPRFVFTSTGSTIGKPYPPPHAVVTVDETSPYNFAPLQMVYPHTKWLAEQEVERAGREGLFVVITHPVAVFGPGDWKRNVLPLFWATRKGTTIAAPNGIRTTCDVRDVATAHLAAAERGSSGRHYILGGEALSVRALLTRIAAAAGGKAPRFTLPDRAVMGLSFLMESASRLTGRPPMLSHEMALQSTFRVRLSSERAARELGYTSRPLDVSLADAARFYREQGWL
ncbi:NAD-dependent epimerase/dehydratase family protein [Polyangium jinanense]|uniref:NAD-dependent epimerase/dehydratase family protein n=1 Tax=Polyangium jinanense TaxID=2829994 RepID=A0A9X3X2X4_9BACT|nr:NAD-dependent epimerase/dehydratase family protein [Polyangium jinanense]MDC3952767.1 NAD-dependent epimerase/dehydratase family protein [Polyangium jinanense]MDC3980386.1 NAD-dependent epimerase/dehydratase family protein [Polyangium jinanense]